MSSLRSNTPDLDDPDSLSGTFVKMGSIYITEFAVLITNLLPM